MFKEILLPTDGSQGVEEAINCAVSIARKYDARIHVLHVVESPSLKEYGAFFALPEMMKELRQAGTEIVSKTVQFAHDSGFDNISSDLADGYPGEEIIRYMKEHQIDLIVMGTHGRRGINRVVLGSIAEEIVRRSEVPVLTIRMSED